MKEFFFQAETDKRFDKNGLIRYNLKEFLKKKGVE